VQAEESKELVFPWEAVPSKVTQLEYKRKSKAILIFAGLVDAKLMLHRPRPRPDLLEKQDEELERGMRLFIEKSIADPAYARGVVIRFIRDRSPRVLKGELTSHAVKNCIWPIKLALEMNDVNASVAGIEVDWSQGSDANCTQYQESWDIFIVNGTSSEHTTMAVGPCISMATPQQ